MQSVVFVCQAENPEGKKTTYELNVYFGSNYNELGEKHSGFFHPTAYRMSFTEQRPVHLWSIVFLLWWWRFSHENIKNPTKTTTK